MYKLLLFVVLLAIGAASCTRDASLNTVGSSKGGSMAKMAIIGGYLYSIDHTYLSIYHLLDQANPTFVKTIDVGRKIETIFAKSQRLYIGAPDGMLLYDIQNPVNPIRLSTYEHIYGCDPVVAEGTTGYLTVRTGSVCGRPTMMSQLEIMDLSDESNPITIASYPMEDPYGLGVEGNLLWVCDGRAGFKVYDCSDPANLQLIFSQTDLTTYDVILNDGLAIVVGTGFVYQFDYTDLSNIRQISAIEIAR